jgi:hypothetical protein
MGKVFHPLELAGWPGFVYFFVYFILSGGVDLVRHVGLVVIGASLLGFCDCGGCVGLDMLFMAGLLLRKH